MQISSHFDLPPQKGIMLSGDARYAVGRLASAVVTMTGAAYVREQLLSDPEVLSGALDGMRVRIAVVSPDGATFLV